MKSLFFLALVVALAPWLGRAAGSSPVPPLVPPPGVVIAASPDPQKVFVFSPSIAILPNGNYVASYDTRGHLMVKISSDRGVTWKPLADLPGQKWSTLFVHQGSLHLIGILSGKGSIVIRRSSDGGVTWSEPKDSSSGILALGRFHCGPTPVVVHAGRVWRAFEEYAPPTEKRERHFSSFVMSAPADANLLDASVWTRSNQIQLQASWLNTRNEEWLEGNVVVTPEGGIANLLRVESHQDSKVKDPLAPVRPGVPRFEVAAQINVSADGKRVEFDPEKNFVHFIGGESKFTIRRDPVTGRYWTLANKITNPASGAEWTSSPHHQRNVLSLSSSTDLRDWTENCRLLSFEAGSAVTKEGSRVGFQYVDWQFDGDDLIAACRTSWDGANYHDSNFITFHRIKNFRRLTMADSPADLARPSEAKTPISVPGRTTVSIVGEDFQLNGNPTYAGRTWNGHRIEGLLLNSRMVQATFDDLNPDTAKRWAYPDTGRWDAERNTREFIAALPEWKARGLLAVTVNFQGGSPEGYSGKQAWISGAFEPDGSLRPAFADRMRRVLDAADAQGMAVILGYFYFGQDQHLRDEAAVIRATDEATKWLLQGGWRNVLVELDNETNVKAYDHAILGPDRVHELIGRVRKIERDGRRLLVGTSYGGGGIPRENVVRASDFLLLHGNGVKDPKRIGEMVRQTRAVPGYRPMPILFNEDDHEDFDKPANNFAAALAEHVSWGWFDYRRKGEGLAEGYQSPPVSWGVVSDRKRAFFKLLSEVTGSSR